jgi:hypothetical protein
VVLHSGEVACGSLMVAKAPVWFDPPNAVCWCSRWTSGSANQLARVGGVCTSGEVERVLQAMMCSQ